MNRSYGKFLTVISILILALSPHRLRSCGPIMDPEEARFMLFAHNIVNDPSLSKFNYTNRFLSYTEPTPETDVHRNCLEWLSFIHTPGVKEKDVYLVLYTLGPDAFIRAFQKGNWDKLDGNPFINWLRKKENRETLKYVVFARQVEIEQPGYSGRWTDWTDSIGKHTYVSLERFALDKCNTRLPRFLRERYAFQAVKMMYYDVSRLNDDYSSHTDKDNTPLIKCYDTYLKGKSTVVADWALLYYGLSFSDRVTRALYLLRAFDRTEEKKIFVYGHLSGHDAGLLQNSRLDNHTLALVHAYKAIKNPGRALQDLKLVCQYDPHSRYIPLLITREVNKLEDWILTPGILGFNPAIKQGQFEQARENVPNGSDTMYEYFAKKNILKDKHYLAEVRGYLQSLAGTSTAGQDVIRLAIAHLFHMEGNFTDGKQYLDGMGHLSSGARVQYDIELVYSLINTADLKTPETRQQLESIFESLEKNGITTHHLIDLEGSWEANISGKDMLSELYLMLCNRLRDQGDVVTAGLLFQKANVAVSDYYGWDMFDADTAKIPANSYYKISWFDKYGSPSDIDAVLRFKYKKNKTPFERRITPSKWADDDFYRDLKGTILLRRGKYDEAWAVMKTIKDDFWATRWEYDGNLRRSSVTSVGTLLPEQTGTQAPYSRVSKKSILGDIVKLQHAIAAAKDDAAKAKLCFMLGNCYYNISYNGKDWMMYSYGKTSREMTGDNYQSWAYYSFSPNDKKYGYVYYGCANAISMYREALRCSHNRELSARCLLMLSVCDKAASEYRFNVAASEKYIYSTYGKYKYTFPYLHQLRRMYSNTLTYAHAVTECPDVTLIP